MRPRPGSFIWLVQHDLRLSWRGFRGMFGSLSTRGVVLVLLSVVTLLHLLAWPVAVFLGQSEEAGIVSEGVVAAGLVFLLCWLLSHGLTSSTRALFSRGDLDLLIAAPLPARRIVAARGLSIAVECAAGVGLLIFPVANMAALRGMPHWLALYPMLAASALLAAAGGLSLAVLLFRLVGPRRTRLISQLLATFIGAGFVLSLQAVNVLPKAMRSDLFSALQDGPAISVLDRGFVWLPVRAALGGGLDLLVWSAAALAIFALVCGLAGGAFVNSALRSAGAAASASPRQIRRRESRKLAFGSGPGVALRRKEWRLIRRDPFLVSQIFLQVVYTLPISVVLWRSQGPGASLAFSVAPAIVVVASQIAASLAWLAISSEDAPEFIATAPVTRRHVECRKLEAVGLPLAAFLSAPLLGLAWMSLETAAWTLAFALGAAVSTSLLNLWHPMPGRRGDLLRRHSQSKIVAVMEHLLSLCWALGLVMAIIDPVLTAIPLSLALGVLWLNRPRQARPAITRRPPARSAAAL